MEPIYELQAEILRTLAHPRRLQIVHELADGPRTVGSLASGLRLSQPNVSQHLAVMRTTGVVAATRSGREIQYRLTDGDIITACALMRAALSRRLTRLAELSRDPAGAPIPAASGGP